MTFQFMANKRTVGGKVANRLSTPLVRDKLSGGEGGKKAIQASFLHPECRFQATASDLCSKERTRPINSPRRTDGQLGKAEKKSHADPSLGRKEV